MATAASSRLVPAVIAAGDVDEWPENDDVVDHGSTVTGTSSFEYISITEDYENEGDDTVEDETDASGNVDEDEDEVTEDSDLGLQIWPNGMYGRNKFERKCRSSIVVAFPCANTSIIIYLLHGKTRPSGRASPPLRGRPSRPRRHLGTLVQQGTK